ncbi:GLPGLI family protein [Polaribacter septentrionalilitoris]|uniref:GLPGLI family protein n=1 Tax=Polaribacter septentrionalilitoris TaxID=2494657 RepID=UPI0013574AD7|nr:GLPGLI family protein [Polaribacter septentrionalilitoris]
MTNKELTKIYKMKALLLIIFISNFCFSQNKSGTIFYKKQTKDKIFEKKSNKDINDMIITADKSVTYILHFNDSLSIFEKEKKIFKDRKSLLLSKLSSAGYSGIIYRNSLNKTLLRQKERGGETFIINYPFPFLNWELKNETKKIGNYLCYKAISKRQYKNSKGQLKYDIIIGWYSQDIPLSYGPYVFGGLPGLILELETEREIFQVTKIKLNNSNFKITEPKKGIKISLKKYDSIVKGLIKKILK